MTSMHSRAGTSLARILIADDEMPARTRLCNLLADIAPDFPHVLAGEATSGSEVIEWVARDPQHGEGLIILLDVEMPGMSGLEAARKLRGLDPAPTVIFVTAFDAFAVDAFEVHAIDYLLKPVRAARLLEALQRALRFFPQPQTAMPLATVGNRPAGTPPFVTIHERGRLLKVAAHEIVYLKAELKYVTIRTSEREYLSEETLGTFEDSFPDMFIRIHRNTLVARSAIAGFERVQARDEAAEQGKEAESSAEARWEVLLHGLEERLPISRRQWPAVRSLLKA